MNSHDTERRSTLPFALLVLATLVTAACSGGGAGGNLRRLAEEYNHLSSAEIKARLDRLDAREHLLLDIVAPTFKAGVFLHACSVDPALRWTASGQPYDCQRAQNEYWQAQQWVVPGTSLEQNVELDRMKLLTQLKCSSGEIDAGSCAMYRGVMQQIDGSVNDTNTVINANIGGQCIVGRDAGCYP
ncbi:MAG: hypothetical protein KC609_23400 [Myxococcales bacterium]|nr:hypothetical protein [Myxococcales bacterium]